MSLRIAVSSQDHMQGNPDAIIELVEYGDYQCPYCGEAYPNVKKVQEVLGNKLRFIFRNFPLEAHPNALHAAIAAEVAGDMGKFWEMHDMLYENQNQLDDAHLITFVQKLGLNVKEFEEKFSESKYVERVEKDMEGALRSGLNGTPSFYINGVKYNGSYEASEILAYIENL
ncbi:DsbA family protein [Acinetobacter lactucae]|uniref:DsbA family protein n=1 Tax=Acinetobacter lactucae TaxID=1785128 RepID=A0A429K496_9GAMM|nr:thioredoxin domain-containing protein [Acinetobacter lactucae]RSO58818.1 DsbA family protein [Acinetobacter lactucae]